MGKPHSDDLRRGVAQAIETDHTYEEAADLCAVSISSVSRFLTRWRRTGGSAPTNLAATNGMRWNRTGARSSDGWALSGIQARLAQQKVVVSQTAIFRFLRHLEFTLKKAYTLQNKTGRTWSQHVSHGSRCK